MGSSSSKIQQHHINITDETRPNSHYKCLHSVCRIPDGESNFTIWVAPLPNHFETTKHPTKFKISGLSIYFTGSSENTGTYMTALLQKPITFNPSEKYSVYLDISNQGSRFYHINDPSEELRIVFKPNAKSEWHRVSFESITPVPPSVRQMAMIPSLR